MVYAMMRRSHREEAAQQARMASCRRMARPPQRDPWPRDLAVRPTIDRSVRGRYRSRATVPSRAATGGPSGEYAIGLRDGHQQGVPTAMHGL